MGCNMENTFRANQVASNDHTPTPHRLADPCNHLQRPQRRRSGRTEVTGSDLRPSPPLRPPLTQDRSSSCTEDRLPQEGVQSARSHWPDCSLQRLRSTAAGVLPIGMVRGSRLPSPPSRQSPEASAVTNWTGNRRRQPCTPTHCLWPLPSFQTAVWPAPTNTAATAPSSTD